MNVEALNQKVSQLQQALKQARRKRMALVAVTAVTAVGMALWSLGALAGKGDCGAFPFAAQLGLNCFVANQPAVAGDINYDFNAVSAKLIDLQTQETDGGARIVSLEARMTALESKVSALATTVNTTMFFADGGTAIPRVVSGGLNSGPGGCGQSLGTPCSVTFSPAFKTTPGCSAMAITPDLTGYNENVVVAGVSNAGVSFYKGQYLSSGVTLDIVYFCVGF